MKYSLNKISTLLLLLAAAPAAAVDRAQWLMGTVCEISAEGPRAAEAVAAAFAEIARLDRVMSLYKPDSELSRLNRRAAAAPFHCSPDLWEAVAAAVAAAKDSWGAFDPTILPVLRKTPGASSFVGWEKLRLDAREKTVFFTRPGMGLDLGGIGKGLALDHAAAVLRAKGISSAFINFGGQVYALGKPSRVEIPQAGLSVWIKDASVSTSGNEERPGHIADPATGKPVLRKDPVTVVAPSGAQADAWSTALFVLGRSIPPAFGDCVIYAEESRNCSRYLR